MNKDEGMFKDWGTGRKDTRAPTDFYQAGTEQGDFYQYEDDKDVSTTAKLRKVGEEVITMRHLQHKVKTKTRRRPPRLARGIKDLYSRIRRGRR